MIKDFNLLATTMRGTEREACYELERLLSQIGDSAPNIRRTSVSGLIAAKTSVAPTEAIEKLRKILLERPYEFRFTLRIIPIEKVVPTDMAEIQRLASELAQAIGANEAFRITVEKRFTKISSHELIEAVAANIKRKVALEKPDRVLLIEIVGGFTGLSLLKADGVLFVQKEKVL